MTAAPAARPTRLVLLGLAGVVAGAVAVAVVAVLAGSGSVEVRLGDDEFEVGHAERMSELTPLLFSDPTGHGRDVWVQHLAASPSEGWTAFDARRGGAGRECTVEWQEDAETFVDPCTGEQYPADGTGLRHYPARVDEDGTVVVDLHRDVTGSTVPR